MRKEDIKETPIWGLFEKGRNYHRMKNYYTDTDRNYRFYGGDQWDGAKLDGVEPVQKNFIKPIVKYKVAVIHDNLYSSVFSSQNYENREFRKQAEHVCEMINNRVARIWEKDKMDFKLRRVTKDAAINGEGIIYVNYDKENQMPLNEIIDKTEIYYGNENDDDIQEQPYILLTKRMPVSNAVEFALNHGMSEADTEYIIGDNDTFEQPGDAAKEEVDNMVTIVYKFYKMNGTVHFSIATRWVEISKDKDMGIKLYPIAHFNWEEIKGSARGEGEVKNLIANQIEVNKTEMRRVLTVKQQAYPQKVVNINKIVNADAVNRVGVTIKTNDQTVDDIKKIVGVLTPAQMSPDVKLLQDDLINMSRELAGAGEAATGQTDPEQASGRAILAVQQAQRAPMTEQRESCKAFIEDLDKIYMEYFIAYSDNGINLEETVTDPDTGEEIIQIVNVPQVTLQQLQASVKVDITPKSVYDRFAQEQTIENLLLQGFFSAQRIGELEAYANALDDDSVAPKQKILEIIEDIKDRQQKIAQIQAQAQIMQQRAQQFLMGDIESQAQQMADAQAQVQAGI